MATDPHDPREFLTYVKIDGAGMPLWFTTLHAPVPNPDPDTLIDVTLLLATRAGYTPDQLLAWIRAHRRVRPPIPVPVADHG
jgi:hypothetical protein